MNQIQSVESSPAGALSIQEKSKVTKWVSRAAMLCTLPGCFLVSSCTTEDAAAFSAGLAQMSAEMGANSGSSYTPSTYNNYSTPSDQTDTSSTYETQTDTSSDYQAQANTGSYQTQSAPTPSVASSPSPAYASNQNQQAAPQSSTAAKSASSSQSQSYAFVGVFRKSTGQKYTHYEDSDVVVEPVANEAAYNQMISTFKARFGDHSRRTYMLSSNRAALVYSYVSYVMGDNKRRLIEHEIVYGKTLAEAQANLDRRVAEAPAIYLSTPHIVYRWPN